MAIVSNNKKGNKYHSEKTGRFVSSGNADEKMFFQEISANFESLDDFFDTLIEEEPSLKDSSTVEEAEKNANELFGGKQVCVFDKNHLFYAKTITKSLYEVSKDFPEAIKEINKISNDFEFQKNYFKSNEYLSRCITGLIEKLKKEPKYANLSYEVIKTFAGINVASSLSSLQKYSRKSSWFSETKYKTTTVGGITMGITNDVFFNGCAPVDMVKNIGKSSYREIHTDKTANGLEYVSKHELGHIMHNFVSKYMSVDENNELKKMLFEAKKSGEITEYAKTNESEFVAEAFADYYCSPENATKTNKKVYDYIKNLYNKYMGK